MTADDLILTRLMRWYAASCDGEWEHGHGVSIRTLDNPGWIVAIETKASEKPLADRPSERVDYETEHDWINYSVQDGVFKAAGGTNTLSRILEIFLELVE